MHFYQQTDTGVEPRHFVPMASRPGEIRPTRMSDVRKAREQGQVWVPSVTTILNVLAKPGLENWKIERHLEVAYGVDIDPEPGGNPYTPYGWIEEVRRLTELEMDKAPTAGSDLHKSLEMWFSNALPVGHPDEAICRKVSMTIYDYTVACPIRWTPERRFVSPLGYGGQVDLSNDAWVIDFKSKQTADKFKPGKMVYDDHRIQLAAYREGLRQPPYYIDFKLQPEIRVRCANVFVCLETGEIDFHEHSETELEKGWRMFKAALEIWKEMNDVLAIS